MMNHVELLAVVRQVISLIGTALVAVAALKFFGFNIPMRGSVSDTALVAIACLLAR